MRIYDWPIVSRIINNVNCVNLLTNLLLYGSNYFFKISQGKFCAILFQNFNTYALLIWKQAKYKQTFYLIAVPKKFVFSCNCMGA